MEDKLVTSFLKTSAHFLEKKTFGWFGFIRAVSAVLLLVMMITTVSDAIGRKFFDFPVFGSDEIVAFLLSLLCFFSICYCAIKKGHFAIDVLGTRFPPRVRLIILTAMYLLSALLFWLVAWRLVVFGLDQRSFGSTGNVLTFLPVYPFVWAGAAASVVIGWLFLVQTIGFLGKAIER